MKKHLLLAVLAVVSLASCTKSELKSIGEEDTPISFQAIRTATKSYPSGTAALPTSATFGSTAFLVTKDQTWAANSSTSQLYINNAEVSYYNTAVAPFAIDTWHPATPYYWSKQGKLTFFAYTPYTFITSAPGVTPVTTANASCDHTDGIKISGYNVDYNVNTDLMVADIAVDKQSNSTTYGFNGVPTLFGHKLCTVKFTVRTDADYTNGHDGTSGKEFAAGDKIFTLKEVSINKVANTGTYTQGIAAPGVGSWTNASSTSDYAIFNDTQAIVYHAGTTSDPADATDPAKTLAQYTFMPQTFADDATVNITIKYSIRTYSSASTFSDDPVTVSQKLYTLQSATANAWQINKAITYNLTFSLADQLIYWDPAVADWTAESHDITL